MLCLCLTSHCSYKIPCLVISFLLMIWANVCITFKVWSSNISCSSNTYEKEVKKTKQITTSKKHCIQIRYHGLTTPTILNQRLHHFSYNWCNKSQFVHSAWSHWSFCSHYQSCRAKKPFSWGTCGRYSQNLTSVNCHSRDLILVLDLGVPQNAANGLLLCICWNKLFYKGEQTCTFTIGLLRTTLQEELNCTFTLFSYQHGITLRNSFLKEVVNI